MVNLCRFEVEVFWVVTLCSVVVGYRRLRVKMDTAWTSETLVSYTIVVKASKLTNKTRPHISLFSMGTNQNIK